MPLSAPISGTLGEFNVGLAAAVGFLNPLGAQLDALIGIGIGPLQFDLAAQLNAALAAQVGLTIAVSDPTAGIRAVLSALGGLAAALNAALALSIPSIEIGLQLSAVAALSGTLAIQLGGLQLSIQAALAIKIPALRAAASLAASLALGPAFAFSYNGVLATVGGEIAALYSSDLVDGSNTIESTDNVYGITLLTKEPLVSVALQAIIQV